MIADVDAGSSVGPRMPRLGVVVRRYWPLILGTAVVAAAIAAAIALNREPTYRATVQLLFTAPGPEYGVLGFSPTGGDAAREAATNVVRIKSRSVAVAAARRLDNVDPDALRESITVWNDPDTNVVEMAADAPSPAEARRTALLYARTFATRQRVSEVSRARAARQVLEERYENLSMSARRLERGLQLRNQIEQLTVLEQIGTGSPRLLGDPGDAERVDNPVQVIFLGSLLGLVLGAGLALIRATSDRRVRSEDDLVGAGMAPVLAAIPRSRALRGHAPFDQLPPGETEAFRRLYARLRFSPEPPGVIVVTAAREGEGASTVAANLAAAGAASGDAVLLVEADLGGGVLSERLRVPSEPGLLQVLKGTADADAAIVDGASPGSSSGRERAFLDILPAGGFSDGAAGLLQSERMEELIDHARKRYALIVIDTPPAGLVADAIPVLRHADGVLVTAMIGRSRRGETVGLVTDLNGLGAVVLGLVLCRGERASNALERRPARRAPQASGVIEPRPPAPASEVDRRRRAAARR